MEVKFVINVILVFLITLYNNSEYIQKNKSNIVHLSFNILDDDLTSRNSFIKKGERHFYLGREHFVSSDSLIGIDKDSLKIIKMLTIGEFQNLEFEKRKSLIDTKNRSVMILNKDQIFEKIYLYEKNKEGLISRFEVEWMEEIN